MGHVFLSYSRKDSAIMQQVRDKLREDNLPVWTDEKLEPGTRSWKESIENALESADCLVVILSPESKKSPWVREEMNYAEAQDVRIFPIMAVGDEKSSVPFGYITAQWIDIRNPSEFQRGMRLLSAGIRNYLGIEQRESIKPTPPQAAEKVPTIDLAPLSLEASKAVQLLQNPQSKWWRRADAATRLGQIGDSRVIPVLEAFLESTDLDLRYACQKALRQLRGGKEGEPEPGTQTSSPRPANAPAAPKPATPPAKRIQTVKIVITGPFSAGKTEFIRSISEIDVVSTEREITTPAEKEVKEQTTVAMDFGRITVDEELVLYLFGTPGQRRFDFMWEILAEGMLGFIVLIDSSKPETFREAKSILDTFRAYAPTPFIVAANKQDHPDAWSPEDLRIALRVDAGIKLVPCVARDPHSVRDVLLELLYSVLEEME
ncbi:MAG: TIR domain-containing protein [Anaerolineaceae bacterium]|nr:TIR domain-containing protein [Anaerolineaceae bacterium]